MFSSSSDVKLCQCGGDLGSVSCRDNHDVSVTSKCIDINRELGVPHFHSLELRLRLGTAEFKLFDDVGHPLEAVSVVVLGTAM